MNRVYCVHMSRYILGFHEFLSLISNFFVSGMHHHKWVETSLGILKAI